MGAQFKPVRFFVLMGVAAFVVCGVTAFYNHRAAHGRTSEERSAYVVGEKEGEEAATAGGKLPTAAALIAIAKYAAYPPSISLSRYEKAEGRGQRPRS